MRARFMRQRTVKSNSKADSPKMGIVNGANVLKSVAEIFRLKMTDGDRNQA